MANFAVVIVGAGRSRRFGSGSIKKPFALLNGRAVWLYSAERFARRADVAQTIFVVSPEDRRAVEREYAEEIAQFGVELVDGGAERFLSVENALRAISTDAEFVAVHDAARPCVSEPEIDRVFAEAARSGAAILATKVVGSLKCSNDSDSPARVVESVSRERLWEARTPQVFERELLARAYRERPSDFAPTDDCGLVERLGVEVSIVEGSNLNLKITTGEDLTIAERFMELVERRN
ncbi:MAG: 2-C-methyl-D-erythritol 4-phosphate cytidylyltransferase [Thermoguttaceae bacterium]|nr:2-C-methyl-D-erythritol 4-phosphate cytidylyltransferase [Thermoguttaceae bacterium]